ncbi:MAG: aspartate/glutamate racemase family protein [Lysobacterales bacterium]
MNHMMQAVNIRSVWSRPIGICLLFLLILIFVSAPVAAESETTSEWLPALLEKESITIVITDSGLGGLSVLADAAEKFRQHPAFKKVNLVFFNALFSDQFGYNGLQTREEKLKVFSSALQSMQDRYAPDIILVACNTLSVLIPDTEFAKASSVPVVGIVEEGVEQIAEQLSDNPSAKNIIFATKTTVDEGTHKNLLLEQGFTDAQVMTQSCPQLTQHIEQGYDSEYTEMLIDAYVDEALSRMPDAEGPLSVSFNCTHFGYSLDFWKIAFASRGVEVAAFLDPNTRMVDFMLPPRIQQRYQQSEITVQVVSMIDIPADRQDSIGRWLHEVSPVTETALRDFELKADLFEWRDLTSDSID